MHLPVPWQSTQEAAVCIEAGKACKRVLQKARAMKRNKQPKTDKEKERKRDRQRERERERE